MNDLPAADRGQHTFNEGTLAPLARKTERKGRQVRDFTSLWLQHASDLARSQDLTRRATSWRGRSPLLTSICSLIGRFNDACSSGILLLGLVRNKCQLAYAVWRSV